MGPLACPSSGWPITNSEEKEKEELPKWLQPRRAKTMELEQRQDAVTSMPVASRVSAVAGYAILELCGRVYLVASQL